jgi:hypothetical protein
VRSGSKYAPKLVKALSNQMFSAWASIVLLRIGARLSLQRLKLRKEAGSREAAAPSRRQIEDNGQITVVIRSVSSHKWSEQQHATFVVNQERLSLEQPDVLVQLDHKADTPAAAPQDRTSA